MPLGDHLRANEHVELARANSCRSVWIAPRRCIVSRSSRATRASGKRARISCLDPLGTESGLLQIWRRALFARGRHPHRVVAIVADRARGRSAPMHGQRHAAVRAVEDMTALPAEH